LFLIKIHSKEDLD